MALNDLTWRKFPRNAINNMQLDYISSCLPDSLRCTPLLFYTTAYCLADDDGVFDIEDGIIFSRVMKVGTPKDIFTIADLFVQRGVILPVDDTEENTVYMLADWDPPVRPADKYRPQPTADQRREIIRKRIQEDRKTTAAIRRGRVSGMKVRYKSEPCTSQPEPAIPPALAAAALDTSDDKKTESTETSSSTPDNSTNSGDLSKQTQRRGDGGEDTEHTDGREEREQTHTHTDARTCISAVTGGMPAPLETGQEPAEPEKQRDPAEPGEKESPDGKNIRTEERAEKREKAEEAEKERCSTDRHRGEARGMLEAWFAKHNPAGYINDEIEKEALEKVAEKAGRLSDERNPPEIVACQFLTSFEKLTNERGYFEGMPLIPSMLVKTSVWSRVAAQAGRILAGRGKSSEKWIEEFRENAEKVGEEKEKLGDYDFFTDQFVKYGISLSDPDRWRKLLQLQHKRE